MSGKSTKELHEVACEVLEGLKERLGTGAALNARERMAIPMQEMPTQDKVLRRSNMNEVSLGFSAEQAQVEALRCLQCKNAPCVQGCPVKIDIPAFLHAAGEGRFDDSVEIIRNSSLLPAVCGRVCPQESQCQEVCTLGKALKSVDLAVGIG